MKASRPARLGVLLVTRALNVGGAERQLILLANGLADRGHGVTVCTAYPGGDLAGELNDRVHRRDLGQSSRRAFPRLLGRLRRLVRVLGPDVIHGYLPTSNALVSLVSRRGGAAVVWGIRASDMDLTNYDVAHRIAFGLTRMLARRTDLIISNSNAGLAFHRARGYPGERMVVVENGIDGGRFHPDAARREAQRRAWKLDDTPVVGVVGRLDPMKDHDTLLRAAQSVRTRGVPVTFVCVGAGPAEYATRLRQLAAQLGVTDIVRWYPPVADVASIYPAFDLVVSTSSYGEGFSNVLGEAMASGVRCVSTDVGDARRIVGDDGVVVPRRDSDAVADAIVRLLAEPVTAACRERRRERIIAQFGVERMVDRTESLLLPFAGRGTARSPG